MASIYKRGPYQWQVLIRRKGFETQARVFNPKVEAESWANVTESEMVRGVFVSRKEAENTTLSEALNRYESEVSLIDILPFLSLRSPRLRIRKGRMSMPLFTNWKGAPHGEKPVMRL